MLKEYVEYALRRKQDRGVQGMYRGLCRTLNIEPKELPVHEQTPRGERAGWYTEMTQTSRYGQYFWKLLSKEMLRQLVIPPSVNVYADEIFGLTEIGRAEVVGTDPSSRLVIILNGKYPTRTVPFHCQELVMQLGINLEDLTVQESSIKWAF